MFMTRESTETLIDLIYDSASDTERWSDVLVRVGERVNASASFLVGRSLKQSNYAFYKASHFNSDAVVARLSRWVGKNPITPRIDLLRDGDTLNTETVLPLAAAGKSEFFNEVLLPLGIGRGFYVSLLRKDDFVCQLSTWRSHKQEPFSVVDMAVLQPIIPHLRRSAFIELRVAAYQALAGRQQCVLDALDTGVILVDENGGARCVNRAAEDLARAADGLVLRYGQVHATEARANAELTRVIQQTAKGGAGRILILPRGCDGVLVVLVCPLRGEITDKVSAVGGPRGAVALFVKKPALGAAPAASEAVASFYGLTPMESRVAELLAEGLGVTGAAEQLDLGRTTVKSHALSVYAKLGVSGQAALAGLYARLAAASATTGPRS